MEASKLAELIERAKAKAAAIQQPIQEAVTKQLQEHLADPSSDQTVDVSKLGLGDGKETTPEQEEAFVEVLGEIISAPDTSILDASPQHKQPGVARDVQLNEKQQEFHDRVNRGESVVLIGAAGTGKTTSMRKTTRSLIDGGKLSVLSSGTKWLQAGKPGFAILSFTRKAVNNIRHAVVDELKCHTLTAHKLIEFAPVYYEIEDPNKPGEYKKTMRFEPTRNAGNPLPRELAGLAWEESSMVGTILYDQVLEAIPHPIQEVFLGDIQQLPPVFGLAILGFKMNQLPVIELTEVYRQALNSPIIDLAWKLLEGNPHVFSPKLETYTVTDSSGKAVINPKTKKPTTRHKCPALDALSREAYDEATGELIGAVKFHIWQNQLSDELGVRTAAAQFNAWSDSGFYKPNEDIILCPYNKAFGTIELNKLISWHLGKKREAVVHEIIAGYNKHYLAVGDRVLYDKEDAYIVDIYRNTEYMGTAPNISSKFLDRWGCYHKDTDQQEQLQHKIESEEFSLEAMEGYLGGGDVEDRVTAASHVVLIKLAYADEDEAPKELRDASEINNLLGGYALTVHKFQGSENERVFLVLHHSHAKMVSRELLYTGVTRARKWLYIICEPKTFFNGITSQRIKGNTLAEKALMFLGKGNREEIEAEKEKQNVIHLHRHTHIHGDVHIHNSSNQAPKYPTKYELEQRKIVDVEVTEVPEPKQLLDFGKLRRDKQLDRQLPADMEANKPIYSWLGARNLTATDPENEGEMEDVSRYPAISDISNSLHSQSDNRNDNGNVVQKVEQQLTPAEKAKLILAQIKAKKGVK